MLPWLLARVLTLLIFRAEKGVGGGGGTGGGLSAGLVEVTSSPLSSAGSGLFLLSSCLERGVYLRSAALFLLLCPCPLAAIVFHAKGAQMSMCGGVDDRGGSSGTGEGCIILENTKSAYRNSDSSYHRQRLLGLGSEHGIIARPGI